MANDFDSVLARRLLRSIDNVTPVMNRLKNEVDPTYSELYVPE
jgi:hypothetical protein